MMFLFPCFLGCGWGIQSPGMMFENLLVEFFPHYPYNSKMFRIYVERKPGFQNEAERIRSELTGFLGISGVTSVRYLNRYDIDHLDPDVSQLAATRIFSEPQSDFFSYRHLDLEEGDQVIVWEYLPGQYDQRSDSAQQCLSLLQAGLENASTESAQVRCAKLVILRGEISLDDMEKIKNYLINPVDSRLASQELPESLAMSISEPVAIPEVKDFIDMDAAALEEFYKATGLAMDMADLTFLQSYFRKEGRNPTETEIRVLDTYWSDHCRHTTFNTVLESVSIEEGPFAQRFQKSWENYKDMRLEMYSDATNCGVIRSDKPVTLMDIAVIGAKYLKKHGKLDDIELSAEINACSIYIDVDYTHPEPRTERWLLMFKNETHNHPTEIEPFGGAATCIGGAIRDPLSGRSWVYQSLRVTGAADPTVPVERTRAGKLPQMKLTREAAAGFSSYGNQIGLATGQVAEIYHPGFEAKRMELGAVIAAAPADMVMREEPECGDVVVLVGGGTGRDGIGGATGSSKVHTVESVVEAAAEVQKGNAVEERKIQRLFRNPQVSRMIRRCNDFGAGGVAVAVGELAPGLDINLDAVPKKYEGLNGTELAISESQERMALVVREGDVEALMAAAAAENLNAAVIARVTDTNRLVMKWRGQTIVDIDRNFLDTAGATRTAAARIQSPCAEESPLTRPLAVVADSFIHAADTESESKKELEHTGSFVKTARSWLVHAVERSWKNLMADLACCSQRGLSERFDGSIGAGTVLFPLGGQFQSTPEAGMAARIPVLNGETSTVSLMSYGYDPRVAQWSPWHGGQVAVLSSLAKIAALGGNPATCRLSFQEYFERTIDEISWGKPAAALLGALEAQKVCGTAAIGGKDSMSGSFQELKVPPTLVSFAVATENQQKVRGGSFMAAGHKVYLISVPYGESLDPNFEIFNKNAQALYQLSDKVAAAYPVGAGGVAEAVTKMAFGNKIGLSMKGAIPLAAGVTEKALPAEAAALFVPAYGSIIVELKEDLSAADFVAAGFVENTVHELGKTVDEPVLSADLPGIGLVAVKLEELETAWEGTLAKVFPPVSGVQQQPLPGFATGIHESLQQARENGIGAVAAEPAVSVTILKGAKPRILLPVFPGTNCEFDMKRAFQLAGGEVKILVFRNNTPAALAESLKELATEISQAQILAFSGGFSAGDEPDGSGKFIANVIREPGISNQVMELLKNRDGLVLGICNGFQALIKTGLVPYGEILEPVQSMPTLTYNTIGRHISRFTRTRLVSALSPWASHPSVVEDVVHWVPISHGEGRIIISEELARDLFRKGQVFTQYVDASGAVAASEPDNPNGSAYAIEGLTSPDGRVLGKMGHSERTMGPDLQKGTPFLMGNVTGNGGIGKKQSSCQNIFAAGVSYFL